MPHYNTKAMLPHNKHLQNNTGFSMEKLVKGLVYPLITKHPYIFVFDDIVNSDSDS